MTSGGVGWGRSGLNRRPTDYEESATQVPRRFGLRGVRFGASSAPLDGSRGASRPTDPGSPVSNQSCLPRDDRLPPIDKPVASDHRLWSEPRSTPWREFRCRTTGVPWCLAGCSGCFGPHGYLLSWRRPVPVRVRQPVRTRSLGELLGALLVENDERFARVIEPLLRHDDGGHLSLAPSSSGEPISLIGGNEFRPCTGQGLGSVPVLGPGRLAHAPEEDPGGSVVDRAQGCFAVDAGRDPLPTGGHALSLSRGKCLARVSHRPDSGAGEPAGVVGPRVAAGHHADAKRP